MEFQPYPRNRSFTRTSQSNMYDRRTLSFPGSDQRPGRRPPGGDKQRYSSEKMSKMRALALAQTLKKWVLAASIVGFGTFSGLVALHKVGATTSDSSSTSSSSGASQLVAPTPTPTATEDDDHGFWRQKGNNFGTGHPSQPSSGSSAS